MAKKIQTAFLFLIILFAGCSRAAEYSPEIASMGFSINDTSIESFDENAHIIQDQATRKLIINANIRIRSENISNSVNIINELMERYGSYASSISIFENSRYYELRVPAENYRTFLEEILEIEKVISYNETTDDVTLRYFDLESRLNTQRELIVTFQNYLSRANSIDEILSVEARIAELQRDINDLGSQFVLLNNLIDYSTINIDLLGSISGDTRETFGERTRSLLNGFGNYISTILIIIIGFIVYGAPSIISLMLLYLLLFGRIGILKKIFKFVSGNKEKNNQK